MEITRHRCGLKRTLRALKNGSVTLGFIGGSITDGRPEWNWPEPVASWFCEHFPGVRVVVENAAIGATGSDLAVFRAQRDLIERGCDLVFIEFAVNDEGESAEKRMRSREGLVRKLLRGEGCDLVFTYTFMQTMYADMLAGCVPPSIAEFEQLAEHYGIGSVWMGLRAFEEVRKGLMRWEEWLPDGLHPQFRGSLSYAQAVTGFLERELLGDGGPVLPTGEWMPAPLNPHNWENGYLLPFEQVRLEGPWTVRRWVKLVWIDQVLRTSAVGARLAFEFEGRGLLLALDFGKAAAEFRYSLDGGGWKFSGFDRPDWVGPDGWYRPLTVADDLPEGKHTFELEVLHADPKGDGSVPSQGTNFNLGLIGVLP